MESVKSSHRLLVGAIAAATMVLGLIGVPAAVAAPTEPMVGSASNANLGTPNAAMAGSLSVRHAAILDNLKVVPGLAESAVEDAEGSHH